MFYVEIIHIFISGKYVYDVEDYDRYVYFKEITLFFLNLCSSSCSLK
jgi:hypothetical protein